MGKLRPGPHPLRNLLLLLWTLLNCSLGGSAQGSGEWTLWGSWSPCSSSCGRGLSVRSRRCIRFPREELCWGNTHEYRLCQLPDCPPGAVLFRDLQCSLYNGHPVLGPQKTYQWVPFYGELEEICHDLTPTEAHQGQLRLCSMKGLPARLREVGA